MREERRTEYRPSDYRFERNSGLRGYHFVDHRMRRSWGAIAATVLVVLLVLAAVVAVPDLVDEMRKARDVSAQRAGRP